MISNLSGNCCLIYSCVLPEYLCSHRSNDVTLQFESVWRNKHEECPALKPISAILLGQYFFISRTNKT